MIQIALKARFLIFTVFVILFFGHIVQAQVFEEFDTNKEENTENEPEKRKVDPYVSGWTLSQSGAFVDSVGLDTLLDNYQIYHPVFINSVTSTYLGNYGTPGMDNDFFNRKSNIDFFFLRSREAYILTPATIQFYNTRTPYTQLDLTQSENRVVKNETRFNVFHTQNVNPYFNFTFKINLAKSAGQYLEQDSKNNFITLYSNYNSPKLSVYTGFISNNVKNNENGGLINDSVIFNGADSELLNVRLNSSKSLFRSNYYFANGEYRFGKTISTEKDSALFVPILGLLLSSQFEQHNQDFIDEETADNKFFENSYYGDDYIKDSIRFNRVNSIFQVKKYENSQRKYSFGNRAFVGIDFVKTTTPGADTSVVASKVSNYSNLHVGGGIFRETGRFWNWNFDGKIFLVGPKAGQTELSGVISKPFRVARDSAAALILTGTINNMAPDYFQNEFYSNHYRWDNNFKMEQRMDASGSIVSHAYKLKLSANYALINNFIYNNTEGIPSQTGKELLVLSASADKDLALRKFHIRTKVLWQQASDETYIHLPDLSAFVSVYYKFLVSKVLHAQLGIDTRYSTKYYADAYSPSTGLFYLQNEKKYGNYPYIDVYANLRLKRTRAFFKMSNIGTGFLDGEYFTSPHYPMPRSTFRLGVSWLFYD